MHADFSFMQRQWLVYDEVGLTLHTYIYIYICSLVSVQGCISLYMYIFRPYMHILGLETVYIALLHMFGMLIWLFLCFYLTVYVRLCAKVCKCMFCCISIRDYITVDLGTVSWG